jgi:hypothetical protein
VWVANIVDGGVVTPAAEGLPHLIVPDSSCTVPYLYGMGVEDFGYGLQALLPYAFEGDNADGGPTTIDRASEGYFEMIEMGSVVNELDGFDTADAVTHWDHDNDDSTPQVPADCQQLVDAWTDNTQPSMKGYWIQDWDETCAYLDGAMGDGDGACDFDRYEAFEAYGYTDISTPTGGLFGGASVVDIQNGSMYSYDAIALAGFDDNPDGENHARPGLITPSLDSGNIDTGYAFLDDGNFEDWTFDAEHVERTVDAVSYALQHDAVMNEFTTEADIGANTEWVVTFPTKNFYVHEARTGHDFPIRPFVTVWEDLEETASDNWGACEPVMLDSAWDRNEKPIVDPLSKPGEPIPPVVSPSVPGGFDPEGGLPFVLCYETNIIRFGAYAGSDADPVVPYSGPTEILASNNVINFDSSSLGDSGWARINLHEFREDDNGSGNPGFPDGVINGDDTLQNREALGNLTGLPVIGFSVQRFQNKFVGEDSGLRANYGGIFSHRGTRKSCTGEACDAVLGTTPGGN